MAMRAENAAALAVLTASTVKNALIAASSVIVRAATSVTVSLLATVLVLIALTAQIAAIALTALNGAISAIVLAAILVTVRVLTTRSLSAIALTDRVRISGPRARAYDTRRFAERSEFARNAMVKIDSDIADFFGSPEAVNQALRLLIDAARTVKFPQAAAETSNAELEPATAAQIFGETDIDDDDVEDSEYGDVAADSADDADTEGSNEVSAEEDKADK